MKFAIIEDRLGRLEQFVEFDLQSYKDVSIITGANFDALLTDLKSKITTSLDQYGCIASHRSAITNEVRDVLKEYCNATNKPLIFFSGGITSSVYKDVNFPFLHINSKDFYSNNLRLFIESLQKDNLNLLIIQFGNRWKLSLLLNLRNRIAVAQNKQKLKDTDSEIEFDNTELIRRVSDLQITSLIKPDLINEHTKDIILGESSMPISTKQISEIKSVINQLINDMA